MNLRHGVTFQDGEPFNATAVRFTFERMLNDQKSAQ
jgi:peptide/nickel transport system substrate-binding protein